ncbi:hypothetical protein [Sphingobium sp.]|nr:hypothetical protein [Sphingobium sp.]
MAPAPRTRQERRDDRSFPRLHHWLLAAIILFVMMLTVPILALFA